MITVAPVVEGHGDVDSIRILIAKVRPDIAIAKPVRCSKSEMLKRDELIRSVRIARANITDRRSGLVLVLLDADTDCPADVGPRLQNWLASEFSDTRFYVAIVVKEFESWICGGIAEIDAPNPDDFGDPKGHLRRINNDRYRETVDQPRFTSRIRPDVLTRRSRSFARLHTLLLSIPKE